LITNLELLLTTAFIAVVSAGLSLIFGVPFGAWLASLTERQQRLVGSISVVPFLLPPLLIGIAALPITEGLVLDSNLGILMIVLAHAFMNVGFVGRVVAGSSLAREQVEAARLDGASDSLIRKAIQLPQQLPSIASAALLVALYSATSYGLILLVGAGQVRTLETEIAEAALYRLDLAQAGTLAILQTLLTLALFAVASRFSSIGFQLNQVGRSLIKSTLVQKTLGLFYVGLVLFVFAQILIRSLDSSSPFANFTNLTSQGTRSLLNISVVEAALNSGRNLLVVLAISFVVAYLFAGRVKQSFLILLPIGVSSVVIGLGALFITGYLPRELSSSWLVVPIVQSLIAIPLAYQILRPARKSLDSELLDAAQLDGAGSARRIAQVELPLLRRPVATAAAFVAMSSLGEFGAASFLAFGSQETLPVVMFRLASRPGSENFGMAMAAGAIYILLTACIVWLSSKPFRTQRQAQ
jgi:thiamine transport system permease protein